MTSGSQLSVFFSCDVGEFDGEITDDDDSYDDSVEINVVENPESEHLLDSNSTNSDICLSYKQKQRLNQLMEIIKKFSTTDLEELLRNNWNMLVKITDEDYNRIIKNIQSYVEYSLQFENCLKTQIKNARTEEEISQIKYNEIFKIYKSLLPMECIFKQQFSVEQWNKIPAKYQISMLEMCSKHIETGNFVEICKIFNETGK